MPDLTLRDRPVLVTGATGFIGGRLARRLALEQGAKVVGTGRKTEGVAILDGTDVTLERADLRDAARMRELVEGVDVVFHVAAWLGSDAPNPDPAHAINVVAVEELVRAAADAGVKRFVQVSSIATYGVPPDANVTEDHPQDLSDRNDEYGRTKAEGEQRAVALAAELGLDLTVVRPGMVYGPGSWTWTAGMVDVINKGVPTLLGRADGHASVVHVDDLIDLMVLLGTKEAAVGEAFNCVTETVTWEEFFGGYGALIGKTPKRIPMWLAGGLAALNSVLPLGLPINKQRLEHYKTKAQYPIAKAERAVGWTPKIRFDAGLQTCVPWLKEIGKL